MSVTLDPNVRAGIPALKVSDIATSYPVQKGLKGVIPFARPFPSLLTRCGLADWLKTKPVFREFSCQVQPGEIVAVMGPNGTGKSTFVKNILRTKAVDNGVIEINGYDIAASRAVCAQYIVVCDKGILISNFTPIEDIRAHAVRFGFDPDEAAKVGESLLRSLGVKEKDLGEWIDRLSTGTKDKVAYVKCVLPLLMKNDRERLVILVLDELTSAMDDMSRARLFQHLDLLRRALPGLTIIVATNSDHEQERCDRVIMIPPLVEERGEGVDDTLERTELTQTGSRLGNLFRSSMLRTLLDQKKSWFVYFLVMVTQVLPIFLGVLPEAHKDMWPKVWLTGWATFYILLVRDASRFIGRERDQYFTWLQTLLSPFSTLRQFFFVSSTGLVSQFICGLGFVATLVWMFFDQIRVPANLTFASMSADCWVGVAVVGFGLLILALFEGFVIGYVPMTLLPVSAFYIVTLIISMQVPFSTFYVDPSSLPLPLRIVYEVNPLSFAANAMKGFVGFDHHNSWLCRQLCPAGSAKIELTIFLVYVTAIAVAVKIISPRYEELLRRTRGL